jgi:replicative DNA helicase
MTDPDHEHLPPQNLDAERAVLGACLISPKALDAVSEEITPDDFYRPAHGLILAAALAVQDSAVVPDAIAVGKELERRGELIRIGGAPYLLTLMGEVPTATNAGYYAEQVRDAAIRRRLLEAGQRTIQLAHTPAIGTAEVVELARQSLDSVAERSRSGAEVSEIEHLADAALTRYGTDDVRALPTPWIDLDQILNGGLRPGTLTVVGARPGVGKSVIGGNWCTHVAQGGVGSLFVSLEMPEAEVTDRIISALSRVEYGRLLTHRLTDDDWGKVQNAVDRLGGMPLRVLDRPYLTLTQIRSMARTCAHTPRGLGLILVDYLQLIQPADTRVPRQEQVAAFSRGLKLLAKELDVPVVALAQLNRGSEQRADKRPMMSDLRESGGIEQDPDHILLLHRDDDTPGELEMNVVKNRGGRTGMVRLGWAPHHQQVRNLAPAMTAVA